MAGDRRFSMRFSERKHFGTMSFYIAKLTGSDPTFCTCRSLFMAQRLWINMYELSDDKVKIKS